MGGQGTKWCRIIAENLNRLSRVLERYRRQTDRRQTDGRRHIANVNSRTFAKNLYLCVCVWVCVCVHRSYGVVSMCVGTGMGAAALIECPGRRDTVTVSKL